MKALKILSLVMISVGLIFAGCSKISPVESNLFSDDGGVMSLAKKGDEEIDDGAKIKDGTIKDSAGNPITLGYDQFGYNYQAHLFNGRYCDFDRVIGGPYEDVKLIMKWNDAWMSNMDRGTDGEPDSEPDGKLDRYYGFDSYIGSGAWLTNHQSGTNDDGTKWTYFVKIVAAPADAYTADGKWYTADGTEIGPAIWGSFATIQEVINDPSTGDHGIYYLSPAGPGFGKYIP